MSLNATNDINNTNYSTAPTAVFCFINREQSTMRGCPCSVFDVLLPGNYKFRVGRIYRNAFYEHVNLSFFIYLPKINHYYETLSRNITHNEFKGLIATNGKKP
jgi:hypothetical protein